MKACEMVKGLKCKDCPFNFLKNSNTCPELERWDEMWCFLDGLSAKIKNLMDILVSEED